MGHRARHSHRNAWRTSSTEFSPARFRYNRNRRQRRSWPPGSPSQRRAAGLLGHPIQVSSKIRQGVAFAWTSHAANNGPWRRLPRTATSPMRQLSGLPVVVVDDEHATARGDATAPAQMGLPASSRLASGGRSRSRQLANQMRPPRCRAGPTASCRNNETGLGAIRAILVGHGRRDVPAFIMTGEGSTLVDAGDRRAGR